MQSKWVLVLCIVILLPLSWFLDDQLAERDCINSSLVNYLIMVEDSPVAAPKDKVNPYLKLKSFVVPSCNMDYFYKGQAFNSNVHKLKGQIQEIEPLLKAFKGIQLKPFNIIVRKDVNGIQRYSRRNIEISFNLLQSGHINFQKLLLGALFHQDFLDEDEIYREILSEVFFSYLNGFVLPVKNPLLNPTNLKVARGLIHFLGQNNINQQHEFLQNLLLIRPNALQKDTLASFGFSVSEKLAVFDQLLEIKDDVWIASTLNDLNRIENPGNSPLTLSFYFANQEAKDSWRGYSVGGNLSEEIYDPVKTIQWDQSERSIFILACNKKTSEKVVNQLLRSFTKKKRNKKLSLRSPKVFVTSGCQMPQANTISTLRSGRVTSFLKQNPKIGFYQIHLPSLMLVNHQKGESHSWIRLTFEELSKKMGWLPLEKPKIFGNILRPKAKIQGVVSFRPEVSTNP